MVFSPADSAGLVAREAEARTIKTRRQRAMCDYLKLVQTMSEDGERRSRSFPELQMTIVAQHETLNKPA